MALGLLLSLGIHLQAYGVLGVLADKFLVRPPRASPPQDSMTVDFELAGDPLDPETTPAEAPEDDAEDAEELAQRNAQPPEVAPEEEEEETPPAPTERATSAPTDALHAVVQTSRDPDVEASEDPRFIARENNRVEEETVARVTNRVHHNDQTEVGEAPVDPAADEGNADEQVIRETRDQNPEADEVASEESGGRRRSPRSGEERVALPTQRGDDSGDPREDARRAQAAREGGVEDDMEVITVSDGVGTFTIRRPRAAGSGGGQSGGDRRQAVRGRRARGGGSGRAAEGPNLRLEWSQFEAVIGRDQLNEEREQYAQQRLSKQRGRSRERRQRWREFRAAIENYVGAVRPGNQTALNAAASPFAEFLNAVHQRIHVPYREFTDNLSPGSPMAAEALQTKLEIVFNGDGTVDGIGVVRTSGMLPFDFTAFAAVMDGQPYPAPPRSILSGDGRVYVHWQFDNFPPFCAIENSRPFILPNPPPRPGRREGPVRMPELGSTVSEGATPDYGLGRRSPERGEAEGSEEASDRPEGAGAPDSPSQ